MSDVTQGQDAKPDPKAGTETQDKTNQTPVVKDDKKLEGEAKPSLLNEKDPNEAKPGAPEKYEDFKVPDGYTLDSDVGKAATEIFKNLGLPQEGAQQLVDFYVKQTQEAAEAPFKLWQDTQKAWVDEIKADPDLGGKLPEVKATISKALDGLGDPKLAAAFREAMDFTGAGNHPAFIRAFYKLSQRLTEGTHVAGKGPASAGQSQKGQAKPAPANALYPDLP